MQTSPDSVLKGRDVTLLTEVYTVRATAFPVATYGCESWTTGEAECCRTDALDCGVGEDSREPPGQQGQGSQS